MLLAERGSKPGVGGDMDCYQLLPITFTERIKNEASSQWLDCMRLTIIISVGLQCYMLLVGLM